MNVTQRSKCPPNHLVGKPMRPLIFHYPRAKFLPNTKVQSLKCKFISQFQSSSRLSTNDAFLSVRSSRKMDFNIPSEIETLFDWRGNFSLKR